MTFKLERCLELVLSGDLVATSNGFELARPAQMCRWQIWTDIGELSEQSRRREPIRFQVMERDRGTVLATDERLVLLQLSGFPVAAVSQLG